MKFVHGKRQRPLKWLAALMTLTGIFLFGAAAGLFTSAWMDNNPRYADTAKAAMTRLGIDMPASAPSGGTEDELAPVPRQAPIRPLPLPLPRIDDDEEELPSSAAVPASSNPVRSPVPVPAESSGSSAVEQSGNPAPIAAAPPAVPAPPAETKPDEAMAEKQAALPPEPSKPSPDERQKSSPGEPQKAETSPAASPVTPVPYASMAAVPSPAVPAKSKRQPLPKKAQPQKDKDHEIERIRRQAGEELQRKPDINDGAARTGTRSRQRVAKKAARHRTDRKLLLAQCERAPNFLRRERCKWDVCGGKWGKEGCPSYDPPLSMF